MRENYDYVEYGPFRADHSSECNPDIVTPVFWQNPRVRKFKGGYSTSQPLRDDGTYPPNACDLFQGVTRYTPYRLKAVFRCGYMCDAVRCWDLYETSYLDSETPIYKADAYVSSTVEPSTVDDAVRRWYAKLADFRVNLAADLATFRQTSDMITNLTSRVANAAQQLRRRNMHGLADALGIARPGEIRRNFGSAWLQLQYGWKPLLGDIHELMSLDSQRALRAVVVTRLRKTGRYAADSPTWYSPNYHVNVGFTDIVTVRAVVTLLNPQRLHVSQLGLQNPMLLAWELLPYSFVVDWFIPVGGYLESQVSAGTFQLSDASVTKTRWISGDVGLDIPGRECIPGKVKLDYHRKVRTIGIPPLPAPEFAIPRWNSTRFLNALALLSNAFRR